MKAVLIDIGTSDMRKREFLAYAEYLASVSPVWVDGDRLALMGDLPEGPL